MLAKVITFERARVSLSDLKLALRTRRKEHHGPRRCLLDVHTVTERCSKGQLGRYLINNIKSPNDISSRIGLIQDNLRERGRDRNYPEGYGLAH